VESVCDAGWRGAVVRPAPVDLADYSPGCALLSVLAAPMRLAIVVELDREPLCVHELVDTLGVSQTLVSQHLRVLRDAGLVQARRKGREVSYTLTDHRAASIAHAAVRHRVAARA
jgi:DNA-binding transcriptional ArsR family regulator